MKAVAKIISLFALLHTYSANAWVNSTWDSCHSNEECLMVNYGCHSALAVNRVHEEQARRAAYKHGGDPSVLDCAEPLEDSPLFKEWHPPQEAECVNNKCRGAE